MLGCSIPRAFQPNRQKLEGNYYTAYARTISHSISYFKTPT